MKVTADTNLLCRIVLDDDPCQKALVEKAFEGADMIVIVVASLCEVCWVLRSQFSVSAANIGLAIRQLLLIPRGEVDREAADAGLEVLDLGGDFADGLIAFEGRRRGGSIFMSFDRGAIRRLRRLGFDARAP